MGRQQSFGDTTYYLAGTSTTARPSWGPQRNGVAPQEGANRGGQAPAVSEVKDEAPKKDILEKEAFPSLGGRTTAAPETVKWGAPNGTKDAPTSTTESLILRAA
eukprot:Skav217918  [mRNA]  locus=scaffold795:300847:303351:- [translate_table: standard]